MVYIGIIELLNVFAIDEELAKRKNEQISGININNPKSNFIGKEIRSISISGNIYNSTKDFEDYREDLMALNENEDGLNYFNFSGRKGILVIDTVTLPENADSSKFSEFTINGKLFSDKLYKRAFEIETEVI